MINIFFFLIFSLFAEEAPLEFSQKREEYRISLKYRRGNNLIYDCRERHFACVNDDGRERCQSERAKSFERNLTLLGCAPLKKFEIIETCEKEQTRLIGKIPDKRFCLNHKKGILE